MKYFQSFVDLYYRIPKFYGGIKMKVSTMKNIFIALLLTVVLFCFSACTKQNEEPTDLPTDAQTDAPTTEELDGYDAIIKRYAELLKTKKESVELPPLDDGADEIEKEIYSVVEWASDADRMGYAIKDLDGNGVDELALLRDDCTLASLFTMDGETPISLEQNGISIIAIHRDGYVNGRYKNEERGENGIFFKRINGTSLEGFEMVQVTDGEKHSYYKSANGERVEIDSAEWNMICEMMHTIMSYADRIKATTKSAGLRFIYALECNRSNSNAQALDFSSYDAVLESYEKIIGLILYFEQKKWVEGEYDALFEFESDEDYYIFQDLLLAIARNKPDSYKEGGENSFGYAKKDLDGNGIEELILMSDSYSLIAIFTEKDGKAVLVSAFAGDYKTWLDENGAIHDRYATEGISEYNAQYSIRMLEGDRLCDELVFGVEFDPMRLENLIYKLEGGKKNEITTENYFDLIDRYETREDLLEVELEYSKRVSGLEFIPLFEKIPAIPGECVHSVISDELGYLDHMKMNVTEVGDDYILFDLDKVRSFAFSAGEEPPEDEIIFEMGAKGFLQDDGYYHFSVGVADGYVEFCGEGAWLVITESDMEDLPARVYMMYRPFVYE